MKPNIIAQENAWTSFGASLPVVLLVGSIPAEWWTFLFYQFLSRHLPNSIVYSNRPLVEMQHYWFPPKNESLVGQLGASQASYEYVISEIIS